MSAFGGEPNGRSRPVADISWLAEDRLMKLSLICVVCGFQDAKFRQFADEMSMLKRLFVVMAAAVLTSCSTSFADGARPSIGWQDYVGSVEDCSTTDYLCLRGEVLNLTVPRFCNDFRGGIWGTTRVLDSGDRAEYQMHSRLMRVQPLHVIGDSRYPHTVYLYTGTGVMGVYTDPEKSINLVSIAESEGLSGLVNAGGHHDRYYHPFIADIIWGRCS